MEDELRCPTCKQLFANPVLLPCFHALCLGCALDIQTPYTPGAILASVTGGSASLNGGTIHSVAATIHPHPSGAAANHHTHSHTHAATRHSSNSSAASTASSATGSESVTSDQDQADKVSILSEADSGVVCCSNTSRPVSYAGTGHIQGLLQGAASAPPGAAYSLTCPLCRKIVFFDEGGVRNLPPYRAMESIVDRFCAREALRCQMCETDPKVASLVCEQCEIRYCDACRELCHPARGPLAKHNLVKPKGAAQQRESVCGEHEDILSMYCLTCKMPACPECINDQRHPQHEVQPISTTCKAQKTELSHNLQQLSEKARSTTEFIQRLKGMSDKVTESCIEFERLVAAQCEALIQAIHDRREYLLEAIRMDKDTKIRILKDQQSNCTGKLQQTTGLIQFCIEALKETDSAAFLQVGSMLINRVANTDMTWHQEVTNAAPRVSPIVDLTLDDASVLRAIDNLNFIQMKPAKDGDERLPAGEMLDDHLISNTTFTTSILSTNTVINTSLLDNTTMTTTTTTTPPPSSANSGIISIPSSMPTSLLSYNFNENNKTSTLRSTKSNKSSSSSSSTSISLKMNAFRKLINYDESISSPQPPAIIPQDCSAENNSVTVAWQAPNHSFVEGYVLELDDGSGGEFRDSNTVHLRVLLLNILFFAWFTFDPVLSGGPGSGLIFSNNNSTVSVEGWEHRVALGSVGFSRGIHYWEFTIDNYTADTDPAFGVARIDVNRNKMLGKDEKSFAMYIDRQRSWFQHNSVHERRVEGGISTGSTIGVLLNLERHTLSFLVNGMPQGSIAFRDLYGVFYPAVSINRGVTLTMHSALDAPQMDYF
ncbi:E3 ubiquitin-protein ligase TRIM9 [Lucilia cuprina]|uniref:E3 ubiquitin-protein ligase TRIM9 n=1 Tax=Lucilia cuprina TaxID=7375 RepID=UPI001F05C292|nr:E3 ubiquitin-protein ligase TRIM9 [Lucilia cuprina]